MVSGDIADHITKDVQKAWINCLDGRSSIHWLTVLRFNEVALSVPCPLSLVLCRKRFGPQKAFAVCIEHWRDSAKGRGVKVKIDFSSSRSNGRRSSLSSRNWGVKGIEIECLLGVKYQTSDCSSLSAYPQPDHVSKVKRAEPTQSRLSCTSIPNKRANTGILSFRAALMKMKRLLQKVRESCGLDQRRNAILASRR